MHDLKKHALSLLIAFTESGSEVIRQIISSKFNIHKPALGFKDLGTDRSNLQIVVKAGNTVVFLYDQRH